MENNTGKPLFQNITMMAERCSFTVSISEKNKLEHSTKEGWALKEVGFGRAGSLMKEGEGIQRTTEGLGAARKMEEDQTSMEHKEKEKDPNMNSPSTIHLKCLGASPDDMSKMKDSMMVGIL